MLRFHFPPPRWRPWRSVSLIVVLVLIAVVGYLVLPSLTSSGGAGRARSPDSLATRAVHVFIVGWSAWVGASIGSFLNVVAWRMPRGLSINGRSICPRCRVQLRARDNLPIFSWLSLGGRCRTCRLPISARYPIVEFVVGVSIAVLAVGELFQLTLPTPTVSNRRMLWDFRFSLPTIVILVYHVVALSTAWAFGLIRLDGNRLPTKLVVFAVAVLVLPMLIYPPAMVVPWQMEHPKDWLIGDWPTEQPYLDALVRLLTALVAAIFLARVLAKSLCPGADPKTDPLGADTARLIDLILGIGVPILIVGWQGSLAIVVIASLVARLVRRSFPSTDALSRFMICVPVAMTIQLTLWRSTERWDFWPSVGSSPWVFLVWGAFTLAIPLWLRDPRDASADAKV